MEPTFNHSSPKTFEEMKKTLADSIVTALNKFHDLAVNKTLELKDSALVFIHEKDGYETIWLTSHLVNSETKNLESSSILIVDAETEKDSMWEFYKNIVKLLDSSNATFPETIQNFFSVPVAEFEIV